MGSGSKCDDRVLILEILPRAHHHERGCDTFAYVRMTSTFLAVTWFGRPTPRHILVLDSLLATA